MGMRFCWKTFLSLLAWLVGMTLGVVAIGLLDRKFGDIGFLYGVVGFAVLACVFLAFEKK